MLSRPAIARVGGLQPQHLEVHCHRTGTWPGTLKPLAPSLQPETDDGPQVMRDAGQGLAPGRRQVGCSARIKKLQRHGNGPWPATLTVVAEGARLPCCCSQPCSNEMCVCLLLWFPCMPVLCCVLVCFGLLSLFHCQFWRRAHVSGKLPEELLCACIGMTNAPWTSTLSSILCDCAVPRTGCQRLEVLQPTSHLSWRVQICADLATPRLPQEALEGRAHWARWAWRLSDPWELAAKATELFSGLFPDVRSLQAFLEGCCLLPAPWIIAELWQLQ